MIASPARLQPGLDRGLDVAHRAADDDQVLAGADRARDQQLDRGGLEHLVLDQVADADARKFNRADGSWDGHDFSSRYWWCRRKSGSWRRLTAGSVSHAIFSIHTTPSAIAGHRAVDRGVDRGAEGRLAVGDRRAADHLALAPRGRPTATAGSQARADVLLQRDADLRGRQQLVVQRPDVAELRAAPACASAASSAPCGSPCAAPAARD